nr:immunoglobulin heavy chain junction region [Macaca mulatta]
CARGGGELDVW